MNSISYHSREHENAIEGKGWFALPVLTEEEAAHLISLFYNFHEKRNDIPPFTLCLADYIKKKEIYLSLKAFFIGKLDTVFKSYRLTGAGFYFKAGKSSSNAVPPHQDWTFVDERVSYSINVWIPLMDVNKSNGAYHIIEGSHKLAFTFRGSNIPSASAGEKFSFDALKYIPLHKGEAIFYDHRLIHATPPNISDNDRISIVLNLAPVNADLLHCMQSDVDPQSVDIYKVDEEFFWKYTFTFARKEMPLGYDKIRTEAYIIPYIMKLAGLPVAI